MCRLIFAACLLITFSSSIKGAEDFIYKLDNGVSIGYCAQHDYFVYYNPNLTLAFLYNSKLNVKMYTDTKNGTMLLVTQQYGYVFASNYTYQFETKEDFMASFDYIWCQSQPYLNMVHGGNCETCNAISRQEFKICLLKEDGDIELSAWPMFLRKAELAQQLSSGFYALFVQSRYYLRNNNATVEGSSTFTYAGIQPKDQQSICVAILFSALVTNWIDHTEELSVVFYSNLEKGDYSAIEKLDYALQTTSILYEDASATLKGCSSGFTYAKKEIIIDKLHQVVTFSRDTQTLDWLQNYKTMYAELNIVYYADINVLVFWYVHANIVLLFDGNGSNYAVYNLYNGVGIIISKQSGKAIITYENAGEISAHYNLWQFRKAIKCATKVIKSANCDNHKDKFGFGAFIQSCYDHGIVYYPFNNNLKHKLYTYFDKLITALHYIKGYKLLLTSSNVVLAAFKRFQLNSLDTEYVKLMHKIGIKAGSCFNTNNMTNVYTDALKSSDVQFKGKIFNDFGV